MAAAAISGADMIEGFPVNLRRRRARRYRMLDADVSGKKKKSKTKVAEESHMSSQIVHRQPSKRAEKLPSSGPRLGAHVANTPQRVIPYARFFGAYRSAMVAPPVARIGEPKNPVRNRNAISIP